MTSVTSCVGSTTRTPAAAADDQQADDAGPVDRAPASPGRSAVHVVADVHPSDGHGQGDADHQVDHEDHAPVGHGQDQRAVERTDHAAELLHRGDDAERDAPALDRVEIGHEREGGRDQAAAADALEEPPGHQTRQVVRRSRHQRADGEQHQGGDQHGHPAAEVGHAPDQRQHRDVPEQEARDDRRPPLELVERDAGGLHHVRQREYDDVGVGGCEGHGDGGQPEQEPGTVRHRSAVSPVRGR